MKSLRLLFFVTALAPAAAFAQGNSNSTPAGTNPSAADQAWTNVLSLGRAVAISGNSGPPSTLAQAKAAQQQRALRARQVAPAAKAFYSAYPADARAAQAKKLEATSSLRGVTDGDSAYDQSAIAIALAYRTDTRNPIPDRLEIAIGVERLQLARRTNKPVFANQPRELEKIATGLRREFADHPRVFDFYTSVARSADLVTADRIARLVVESPATPEAKAEARAMLERSAMVGRPFLFAVPALDGSMVDLGRHNDRPTVMLVYSAAISPGSLAAAKRFAKTAAADCRWVYVAVNSTAAQAQSAKARAPFPGTHCALATPETGLLLDRLRLRHFPFVYVVNRRGQLSGFGPIEELPGLVWDANR